MPLEVFSFIPQLVATNPLGTDPKSQGDDHIRGVKATLQNQFPAFTGEAVTLTEAEVNTPFLPRLDGYGRNGLHVEFTGGLDTIVTNSVFTFAASETTNKPIDLDSGFATVYTNFLHAGSTDGTQVIIGINSTNTYKFWMRNKLAGAWSTWRLLQDGNSITISGNGALVIGAPNSSVATGNLLVDDGVYIGIHSGDSQIRGSSAGGGSNQLFIGNQSINTTSDKRLKTDIQDSGMDALGMLDRIRVVDHTWNDPSDTAYNNKNARGRWTSIIAQELVKVFPFAVNAPRKESDLSIDQESESKWIVNQDQLVPVLIKAIQEIKERLVDLE